MQAIIKFQGNQYWVNEDSEVLIPKLGKNTLTEFSEVLLLVDGEKVTVGTPTIPGLTIKATVVGDVKGDKVKTLKFKAKSRYRKQVGIRPVFTKVKIDKIGEGSSEKPPIKAESKPQVRARKTRETKS